jgi:hypothetical protein
MIPPLLRLAALAILTSNPSGTGGDGVPPDLEFASISVMDGVDGGLSPRVVFAAAFDRVERGFRAWRRKGEPGAEALWSAELTPDRFRALLELAVSSGLPKLPVENPPGCRDVYEQNIQIRLDYGDVHWVNGAPDGCVLGASSTMPSDEERRSFDSVIERLTASVDALPLQACSGFDWPPIPFLRDAHAAETYRRVMKHVLADPIRDRLDLESGGAWDDRASFFWRGRSTGPDIRDVDFIVEPSGKIVRRSSPNDTLPADRRFAPIETGMRLEDVLARLGRPDQRVKRPDGSIVLTYHPGKPVWPSSLAPARLRFENGRLCPP